MKKSWFGLTAGLLTLLVLLSGCAKTPETLTPATTPPSVTPSTKPIQTSAAPAGPYGELKMAVGSFSRETFYPPLGSGSDAATLTVQMVDTLTGVDGAKVVPGLAEKFELAPDGQSWKFYIRKGVKFHNGDALTAKDVKFTLELAFSKEATETWIRESVDHVEIVDDYTVQVFTKGLWLDFPYRTSLHLGAGGFVVPKDYLEKNGIDYFKQHPVGSGPFRFLNHVPGDMVQYEALDKHWRQTPSFKKLTMILMPEMATRIASLKTGAADIIDIGIEESAEVEAAGLRTERIGYAVPCINFYGTYEPQAAAMPLGDVRVRKALTIALNREEIGKTIFYGKAGPPMPPLLTENAADIDVKYWRDYCAEAYRYDPEEARRLLKEAGYPNGFTFKLYAYNMSGSPYLPDLAEVAQGYWSQIGVKAELLPVDWGTFRPMRIGGANKAPVPELIGNASTHAASERVITAWQVDRAFRSKGTQNLVASAFPELDKLMDISLKEVDATKRQEALAKVLKTVIDVYVNPTIVTAPAMCGLGPNVDIDMPSYIPEAAIGFLSDIAGHRK